MAFLRNANVRRASCLGWCGGPEPQSELEPRSRGNSSLYRQNIRTGGQPSFSFSAEHELRTANALQSVVCTETIRSCCVNSARKRDSPRAIPNKYCILSRILVLSPRFIHAVSKRATQPRLVTYYSPSHLCFWFRRPFSSRRFANENVNSNFDISNAIVYQNKVWAGCERHRSRRLSEIARLLLVRRLFLGSGNLHRAASSPSIERYNYYVCRRIGVQNGIFRDNSNMYDIKLNTISY